MPRGGDNSRGRGRGCGGGRGHGRGHCHDRGEKRPHASSHSSDSESTPQVKKPLTERQQEEFVKEDTRKWNASRHCIESGSRLLRIAVRRLHKGRELYPALYRSYFSANNQE